ncbi:Oidioi.mRNA.OKI2018_I69.chr2.g6871.t1.cds [Oikopleura dioica]|uniref:Oidioi.mRNA.OKI2018_I69.chr2.g6871.t1.cds n=1 Tax=Oikopleura dioica TaxID=34765 RepID=A0ABN7TB67_OIKDI|nr:Oidioi.mRNA.OKI2018_I69.chr2.g6871.t1.cds [Oikopleura dioica]
MVEARSTFALPNRLTQIALYPHQNTYLNENCGRQELDFFPYYTRENCLEECRYKNIVKTCKCVPPYLPNYKDFPPCKFRTHAMCISPQFMLYNFTECSSCPRECVESVFTRNVEYGKYHEPIYRTLAKYSVSQGAHGIDIAAFQIFFPQLVITKRHQRNEYNLSQFFSELGGSTGLVLGISFLSIIRFMDDIVSVISRRIRAKFRKFCKCYFGKPPDRPRSRSIQTLAIGGSIRTQPQKDMSPLQNL